MDERCKISSETGHWLRRIASADVAAKKVK